MSIEHKAWLLNYELFSDELADILFHALDFGETQILEGFIDQYHGSMTDLWTWKPLRQDWQEVLRKRLGTLDVLSLGDIALTRYYDPTDDVGLSYGFDALGKYLNSVADLRHIADALIGGYWFGPKGKRFDPGGMGTGFVSLEQAREHLALLAETRPSPIPEPDSIVYQECLYKPETAKEVQESLNQLKRVYEMAVGKSYGVLLADFNDLPQTSPTW